MVLYTTCRDQRAWEGSCRLLQGPVGMLQAGMEGRWPGWEAPGAGGPEAPECLLSPTRWHWEPCDVSLSPGTAWLPLPRSEHRGTRARSSSPFPPGAEHHLGAGVTQCQSSQERVIPTCPVLYMLTWPPQESLQGVVSPVELVASKIWWESEPGMCKSQGISARW